MKKISIFAVIFVLVIAMATGCSQETAEPIVIGEGDWDSNAFHDQVVKLIIEEGYGYEVDIVMADTSVLIAGLTARDIDLNMELWSDNIPTYQEDQDNGYYQSLSTNFDDNMQGLYVPTYLVEGDGALAPDLKSVKDLVNYKELFLNPEDPEMGIIYGGPEGWKATEFLYKKVDEYGLADLYDFKPIDSGATLAATIASAYEKGEPWVGYYWEPTWIMGIYDMTLLEDSPYSQEDYDMGIGSFPTVDVNVVATPDFIEAYPELAEFLSNYVTSSQLTSLALGYMQENEVEADEAAKWFLKENDDMLKSWVSEDAYANIVAALE